jgi:nucleoside-diphosphate-sugar epimerase
MLFTSSPRRAEPEGAAAREGWFCERVPASPVESTSAALEAFILGLGMREGWPVCAVAADPAYGIHNGILQPRHLEALVEMGHEKHPMRTLLFGSPYVHYRDVAKAVAILPAQPAEKTRGRVFECGDILVDPFILSDLLDEISGALPRGKVFLDPSEARSLALRRLGWCPGGRDLFTRELAETLRRKGLGRD